MEKKLRHRIHGVLALLLLLSLFGPGTVQAVPETVSTSAEAAALIDVQSGRILWSSRGDKPMLIASTTKIMTAIVAIEHGNLSDRVTVSSRAFGKEGSSLYLKLGEKMSLHHLLYGLMLRSGNDAAVAIAEHVGGSVEGFSFLMNQKAAEIGMTRSHFVNPHGLNAEEHYSTAKDMARLAAYALQNPVFQQIVKTRVKKAPNPNEDWDYTWYNKNKMLSIYEGADGVKTGYTKKAGRCLVSSATRDGRQLAVVTLNDPNDWVDHARLLDYGFEYFPVQTLTEKGAAVNGNDALVAGSSFRYPLTAEEAENIRREVTLYDEGSVQYRLGERGKMTFYLDDRAIGSVPVYDRDGDRLNLPLEAPAFRSGADEGKRAFSGYAEVLESVLKELFVWSI